MINIPPIKGQERYPVPKQLDNIRTYLFSLANELQRTLSTMNATIEDIRKENAELKARVAELEGKNG